MRKSDKPYNDDYKDVDWDDELYEDSLDDAVPDKIGKACGSEDRPVRDADPRSDKRADSAGKYEYESKGRSVREAEYASDSRERYEYDSLDDREERRRRDRYEYDASARRERRDHRDDREERRRRDHYEYDSRDDRERRDHRDDREERRRRDHYEYDSRDDRERRDRRDDREERRRRDRYEYDSRDDRERRDRRDDREERRRRDRYEYDSRDDRERRDHGDDREDRKRPARVDRKEEKRREKERLEDEKRRHEEEQRRRKEEQRESRRDYDDRPKKKKSKGGCCLGGCLIPVILFFAAIFGVAYLGMGLFTGRMQDAGFSRSSVKTNSDMPSSTTKAMSGYRNVMLFGVDARNQNPLGEGALADSCMLLSINKKTGDIQILSIYRDTYVETTDGSHKKLTEVYAASGPKETLQTINRNFDLAVDEYVTYTWAAVAHYIDGIGGMDIKVTAAEAAGINKYIDEVIKNTGISSSHVSEDISSEGETCHLDGVQAVTFCRLRKGLGDDYKRTERQRTVVAKAVSMAKHNPVAAAASAYNIMPEIASNLKQADILSLMGGFLTYDLKNAAGFPYETDDVTLNGSSFLYANTLIANNRKLHEELFGNHNYEPSGTVEELHRQQGDKFGY